MGRLTRVEQFVAGFLEGAAGVGLNVFCCDAAGCGIE